MTTATVSTGRPAPEDQADDRDRIGAVAGLAFVAIVLVQNAIRGGAAPAADADAAEVIAWAVEDRALAQVLAALFAVNALFLALFVGSVYRRVRNAAGMFGPAGLVGAAAVFSVFASMVAVESTLVVLGDGLDASSATLLWTLHNSLFGLNMVSLAVALGGLGVAAAAAGLAPTSFGKVALVGAALLAVTGAAPSLVADGSPIMALGLVGFLTWLAFMVIASLRLLRTVG